MRKARLVMIGMAAMMAAAGLPGIAGAANEKAHPGFVGKGIRRLLVINEGEETFEIAREPADYKMKFDYWEIKNPYDEIQTVDTEAMYALFDAVAGIRLEDPEEIDAKEAGIEDSDTSITIDYVDTVNEEDAAAQEEADASATLILGNEDGEGGRYLAVKGYEDMVYTADAELLSEIVNPEPFSYILKIPALVNIEILDSVEMAIDGETYTMSREGDAYRLGKKKVKKDVFTGLYQAIQGVILDSEADEGDVNEAGRERLSVTFHTEGEAPEVELVYRALDDAHDLLTVNGKTHFLVQADDVDALVAQIEEAF